MATYMGWSTHGEPGWSQADCATDNARKWAPDRNFQQILDICELHTLLWPCCTVPPDVTGDERGSTQRSELSQQDSLA